MSADWEDQRVIAGLSRQLLFRRRMLERGATSIGWKVGFGGNPAMELIQTTAPLLGFLTDDTVLESGSKVDAGGWVRGVIEFEVAVYLGQDLGPAASDDEAAAAISAVGPAIELADIDLPLESRNVEDILAGNIFHQGVVFGEPDHKRAGLDVEGLIAKVSIDGEQRHSVSDLQAGTGAYSRVIATVADTLAAIDERLRAGDVIITGSVIPPVALARSTEYVFTLDPLGSLSIETL